MAFWMRCFKTRCLKTCSPWMSLPAASPHPTGQAALCTALGGTTHIPEQIYTFIMTISGQKAEKCLIVTKSVENDNSPTFGTKGSQERGAFFL